jgi:hypothetical protein
MTPKRKLEVLERICIDGVWELEKGRPEMSTATDVG